MDDGAPRRTRLILYGPNGAPVTDPDGQILMLDLTSVPNADATARLEIHVEQPCDLGFWHTRGQAPVPLYDQ